MKIYLRVLVCIFFGTFCSESFEGEFREFVARDGRVVIGRIIECDKKTRKIRLERENGGKIWAEISIFSEEELEYIKEWQSAFDFLSNNTLTIKIEKKEVSGESIQYEAYLCNRGEREYANLEVEYCIYIEAVRKAGSNHDDIRCVRGSLIVENLKPKKSVNKMTIAVPLKKKYIKETKQYTETDRFGTEQLVSETRQQQVSEDRPVGIWFRIRGPSVEKKKVVRDVCYPSNLRKEFSLAEMPAAAHPESPVEDKTLNHLESLFPLPPLPLLSD